MEHEMKTYRQIFDEDVETYSVEDMHEIAEKLSKVDNTVCNEDAVSLYHLSSDFENYCDIIGTDRSPKVSEWMDDFNTINNKFGNILATSELYTSKSDAKYMSRATELGVGEIIKRNSDHYSEQLFNIGVTSDNRVKSDLSDYMQRSANSVIDKVLHNFPDQKDEYIEAVNERERYLNDLYEKQVMEEFNRNYFKGIDPEEVRDRIIKEENMDVNESYDNLPWYVTERLKNEAGITDSDSYKEPWKLKYDEESGTLKYTIVDIDDGPLIDPIPDPGPSIIIDPIPDPGPGVLVDPIPDFGPNILIDPIPDFGPNIIIDPLPPKFPLNEEEPMPGYGLHDLKDLKDQFKNVVDAHDAYKLMYDSNKAADVDDPYKLMYSGSKVVSAVITWRDNVMPAGQSRTDDYSDDRVEGDNKTTLLANFLKQNGFATADRDLAYEVKKFRVFDSVDEYLKAASDGFKTYDATHDVTPPFKNLEELDGTKPYRAVNRDKVVSTVINWRDNDRMPDGQSRTDRYYDDKVPGNDKATILSNFLKQNGFASGERDLTYEVQKLRVFDTMDEYSEAFRDDFKAYDATHDVKPPFRNLVDLKGVESYGSIDRDGNFDGDYDGDINIPEAPKPQASLNSGIDIDPSPAAINEEFSKKGWDKDYAVKDNIAAQADKSDATGLGGAVRNAREAKMQQIKDLAAQAKDNKGVDVNGPKGPGKP